MKAHNKDEASLPINQLSDEPHFYSNFSCSVTADSPSESPGPSSSGKVIPVLQALSILLIIFVDILNGEKGCSVFLIELNWGNM